MIIDVSELLDMPEFTGLSQNALKRKLQAIESLIRSYTNNNFQNRQIRFEAPTSTSALLTYNPYLKVGDTIQITESINDGLYVVTAIDQLRKKKHWMKRWLLLTETLSLKWFIPLLSWKVSSLL